MGVARRRQGGRAGHARRSLPAILAWPAFSSSLGHTRLICGSALGWTCWNGPFRRRRCFAWRRFPSTPRTFGRRPSCLCFGTLCCPVPCPWKEGWQPKKSALAGPCGPSCRAPACPASQTLRTWACTQSTAHCPQSHRCALWAYPTRRPPRAPVRTALGPGRRPHPSCCTD